MKRTFYEIRTELRRYFGNLVSATVQIVPRNQRRSTDGLRNYKDKTKDKNMTMEIYTTKILPRVVARKEELDRKGEGIIF
jgi:hypothetical protein